MPARVRVTTKRTPGLLQTGLRYLTIFTMCTVFGSVAQTAHALPISGMGTWESTLQGRDLDGNPGTFEAYYDVSLDITWLTDANAGAGSNFDNGNSAVDGKMTWASATSWATGFQIYGITGWRLPTVIDTANPGCDFAYSGTDCGFNVDLGSGELANMFYSTLGNKAYYDVAGNPGQPGWGLVNTGPFANLQSFSYWTDTAYAGATGQAWHFDFILGHQGGVNVTNNQFAWIVRDGDIAEFTVPLPAAAWLLISGLFALWYVPSPARRRRRKYLICWPQQPAH